MDPVNDRDDRFIRGLRIDWDRVASDPWLQAVPAVAGLRELEFPAPATFLVGENGSGKSTLLEAVAVAYGLNPEGGTLNYRFSTHDHPCVLAGAMTLVKGVRRARTAYFFRAESFFNVATQAEAYDETVGPSFGGRSLHEQSHGESFLSFFQTFDGPGLYLMDEPEAALSPQRQLTLLLHLMRLTQAGAQIIAASHSPILLGMPGAQLLSMDGGGIRPIRWEDTGSYAITRLFLERGDDLLRRMAEEK